MFFLTFLYHYANLILRTLPTNSKGKKVTDDETPLAHELLTGIVAYCPNQTCLRLGLIQRMTFGGLGMRNRRITAVYICPTCGFKRLYQKSPTSYQIIEL